MNLYDSSLAAFRSGATDQAARLADELVRTARAASDVQGEIDGLCMIARVGLRRADFPRVAMFAAEARNLANDRNDRRLERMPLHLQAAAARMQGNFESARELYTESIALNRQLGEDRMVAAEHRNLAYVELHDGNAARARELFASSATLARACGYEALEPYLLLDSAVLALESGDTTRAQEQLSEATANFEAAGQIPDPDDAAELEWLRGRLG
jgi:tetratricopeptide (TPR) repeat protein